MGVDPTARVVQVRTGDKTELDAVPYDHLVLALGSVPNYFGLLPVLLGAGDTSSIPESMYSP
jgi:NADH dehydrogenase FAD-containing subunit